MAVDTRGGQVVLAGPAPDPSDRVGDQGPVAGAASVLPLPGSAVTALVDAIPGTTLIDPTLKQAAALAPPQPKLPADINAALDVSLLKIGRAHVCTPVTNAQIVCSHLIETKKIYMILRHVTLSIESRTCTL